MIYNRRSEGEWVGNVINIHVFAWLYFCALNLTRYVAPSKTLYCMEISMFTVSDFSEHHAFKKWLKVC